MYKLLLLYLFVLMAGCSHMSQPDKNTSMKTDSQNSSEQFYWVNSWRRTCEGVGERMCLQIQKIDEENQQQADIKNWSLLYAPIKGFNYELGHIYKIRVQKTQLPPAQVPADASSIRYELLEVVERQADDTLRLHDIWALTEIQGESVDRTLLSDRGQDVPSLEFNLTKMQVFGTDSCNRLSGGIVKAGQGRIEFGALATTLMACPEMKLADEFTRAINNVKHYQLSGLKLTLLNAEKQPILQFKKVD